MAYVNIDTNNSSSKERQTDGSGGCEKDIRNRRFIFRQHTKQETL